MAKILNRLSQAKVTHAKPGIWPDGGGLYLQVTPNGGKSWFFRFTRGDKERRMGLGSLTDVGLAKARDLAAAARALHQKGVDPIDARDADRQARAAEVVTFKKAFDTYFETKRQNLSNAKHKTQWQSTMDTYVLPEIGRKPVADVTPGEIIDLLKPIWRVKPETARRVLQRINAVFVSAVVRQLRAKANPCIGVAKELGEDRAAAVHHRALPYRDTPAFLARLRTSNSWPATRLAFEWLVLTATRSGETRFATWREIDEDAALWTIPASRLKTRRKRKVPHVVPLPDRCVAILQALKAVFPCGPDDLLFPSMKRDKPLSDMTLTKVLRDMGLGEVATPHGFRSAFKDWCAEVEKVRNEVSEAALAHLVPDEVEGAYKRTQFLEERRGLMADWAAYCMQVRP
jgi:integrase